MASPLAPTTYDPERIDIDPETGTVEGRVAGIISKGGPLQQVGETKALQLQNRRGLLNTSMTIGEVQKANIESALPIASQDVQTSFESQLANQAAANRASEFGAGYFQQLGTIGATGEQDRLNIGAGGVQERLNIAAAGEMESTLMGRKAEIDKELLTASADEQLRLIAEQGNIDTSLQRLRGAQAVEQIETSGDVERRLTTQRGDIESRIQTQQGEITKQLIDAEGDVKEDLIRQQGLLDVELAKERGDIAISLQNELAIINGDLETLRAGFTSENLEQQRLHETELTNLQATFESQIQELIGSQALEQQGLRGEQAEDLARLQNNYDTMIATQRNAAILFTQTSSDIAQILANPDIANSAKSGLIQQLLTLLNSSLAMMGGISDMDLLGLLDFSGGTTGDSTTGGSTTGGSTTGGSTTGDILP